MCRGENSRESPSRPKIMIVISICLPPYSGSVFLKTHCRAFLPQYNLQRREGCFKLDSLFPDWLTVCFPQTQAMTIRLGGISFYHLTRLYLKSFLFVCDIHHAIKA